MTLLPILALVGISLSTIAIVAALTALSELLGRALRIRDEPLWADGLSLFAVLISLFALITGVVGSMIPGLLVLMLIGALATVSWIRGRGRFQANPQEPSAEFQKVLSSSLLYSATLALLGWSSLRFFSLGLAAYLVAEKLGKSRLVARCASLAIPAGFVASLNALGSSSGQFWLSFDQLYRSALAAGMVNWGINDHIGATGTPVRYHWLGEAVSGVLADFTSTTAIDGVTRLVPALGVLLCITTFLELGRRFSFGSAVVSLATAATLTLGQIFEVYSTGSLWGIALFLLGASSLESLRRAMLANPTPFWRSWIAILVVTPLISMSQSTLGLHFVVFTAVLSGITWLRTGSRLRALTTLVALQLAILLLLRMTLLAATDQNFYQPTFSLQNIMQFRGIELYSGFRITYVVAASILFLLVISQLLAGVWLVDHKSDSDRRILGLLAAVGISSLILANLFSIGSQEAQQSRFLIPLITLGTFFSLCLSLRHVNRIWTLQTRSARIWAPAIPITFVFGSVSLYGKYVAFDLPWSQLRTLAIGLMIASAQLILVLLVVMRRRWSRKNFSSVLIVCMLLATTLTADGRQIRELIGLHQSSVSASRAELIIGGSGAKRCLEFVRANTPEDEIIASNWQRIPLALRDSKYFLVSATVERRTYVDGPNYVGYPRDGRLPGWLESRVNVVDGFAERVDPQSFAELRAAGIRYFLVDARESPAGDWQPFADIVVETDTCYVLKLRV